MTAFTPSHAARTFSVSRISASTNSSSLLSATGFWSSRRNAYFSRSNGQICGPTLPPGPVIRIRSRDIKRRESYGRHGPFQVIRFAARDGDAVRLRTELSKKGRRSSTLIPEELSVRLAPGRWRHYADGPKLPFA